MTARNCGVIAPGNHWILDSLRGAPPPGEAMVAAAPGNKRKSCRDTPPGVSAIQGGGYPDTPGGVSLREGFDVLGFCAMLYCRKMQKSAADQAADHCKKERKNEKEVF